MYPCWFLILCVESKFPYFCGKFLKFREYNTTYVESIWEKFANVVFATHFFTNFNFPPLCTDPMSHLSISCVLTLQALVGVKIFYNFINHHSMALIRIFIVLTWNPSDSIYVCKLWIFNLLLALASRHMWNQCNICEKCLIFIK